ncbi:MAG: ACR3 family arsenite efflux transporter [Rothia sp. (in: high G+C Gram-positive bacteria)]|nr:ACR3 family arsenite efflux transporter [Rothia sp. (in: high G+C Gram-positive bacteria)]
MDRWLALWIILAMRAGLLLGNMLPELGATLESWKIGQVSFPIALGLLVMMYPPLAKVRYDKSVHLISDKRLMTVSVMLNWVLGPALMFVLAWVFVPDLPEFRTGLIIVGLARCIAMVLIWNDLACGDREAAATLVAINPLFQVFMFGVLGWFYLQILPNWLGLPSTSAEFSFGAIVSSVVVFLGIPLLLGFLSRMLGEHLKSRAWYEQEYLPKISPLALLGLLYTIVLLFALQGEQISNHPSAVGRLAIPLLAYFIVMFFIALFISRVTGMGYEQSTTVSFTAAGNNFELAIAVCIGTFGAHSGQALAGTIGPLIEVPVLITLVYVLRWIAPKLFKNVPTLKG